MNNKTSNNPFIETVKYNDNYNNGTDGTYVTLGSGRSTKFSFNT